MSRMLVLGSCRVGLPFRNQSGCSVYPSYIYSCCEIVQALRILNRQVVVPTNLQKYVFRWGVEEADVDLDLEWSACDAAVIEISSIKSYYHRASDLWFHLGYKKHVNAGRLEYIGELEVHKEAPDQIRTNLDRIQQLLLGVPLIIVSHNNIEMVPIRYELASILSTWCYENGHTFVDPTSLIAEHGVSKCVLFNNGKYDFLHYTPYMGTILSAHLTVLGQSGLSKGSK